MSEANEDLTSHLEGVVKGRNLLSLAARALALDSR